MFPQHERPNASRLEVVRSEITSMRACNWPYSKITDWLSTNRDLSFSKEAIRQFCRVRKIAKGGRVPLPAPTVARTSTTVSDQGMKFEYDETQPIVTRRNISQ